MDSRFPYVVGGTVQAEGGVYIERPADSELLRHCLVGDFCYVLTARQLGKSSLMVRTAERLRDAGIHTIVISLEFFGTRLSDEQWYLGINVEIAEQLGFIRT